MNAFPTYRHGPRFLPGSRGWVIGLALCAIVAGCARNPVTGAREFVLISESQEIAMGQDAAKQVAASIGLVDDPGLQAYVQRIGKQLAARSERPNLPWSFAVVDDPTPNAFALPGGPIFITRGLLSLMDSEAEMVSVLGHEIGHITARHSVTQMSRAQLAQIGLGLGMIFAPSLQNLGAALSSGMQLLFLKYGRDDERQSDDLGFKYALSLNYDVREMDDVFASLARAGQMEQGDRSPLPSWLSTHPEPEERIQRINQKVAALPSIPANAIVNKPQYMAEIEGMVYGANPRQGFFRGSEFLHPDLRFRLQFPEGWRTQNLTQAVMAGSPGQDAVIQLTIAEGSSGEAASRFFGQQGIQAGTPARETVNGLPAVSGTFQAQTQEGVLAGLATFLEYDGKTYQLLSFTPSARWSTYAQQFRSNASSFAQLTDTQALNVRPNRVSIVRLPSAMTLTEFNRRYPSTITIEQLALINQVENVNATIPSGTQLKRVAEG